MDVVGSIPTATTTPDEIPGFASIRTMRPATAVYFILATNAGSIKIGSARSPYLRLEQLQVGCPERLEIVGIIYDPNAMLLERRLHDQFAHLRERGEWFRCEDDLIDYIAANRDPPDDSADLDSDPELVEESAQFVPRPRIPEGVEAPKGNSRKAIMARYKLARGIQ